MSKLTPLADASHLIFKPLYLAASTCQVFWHLHVQHLPLNDAHDPDHFTIQIQLHCIFKTKTKSTFILKVNMVKVKFGMVGTLAHYRHACILFFSFCLLVSYSDPYIQYMQAI